MHRNAPFSDRKLLIGFECAPTSGERWIEVRDKLVKVMKEARVQWVEHLWWWAELGRYMKNDLWRWGQVW